MKCLTENMKCEIPKHLRSIWCAIRFKSGPREGGVKIVVIAWNGFAKACYNHQQTQGVKNFKWQLGAGQIALQLVQSALFNPWFSLHTCTIFVST